MMMIKARRRTELKRDALTAGIVMGMFAAMAGAQVVPDRLPDQLPDPVAQSPAAEKPIQVFILMGQSNMLGFGRIDPVEQSGTLSHLVNDGMYPHLVDDDGNWTQRNDVRNVHVMDNRGYDTGFQDMKNEWLTVTKGHIGPELQFGHIMGHIHDEPVLILKACIGNRSLGWDLLPPGSERFEYGGRTYAGYKDEDSSWTEDDPYDGGDERNWYAGKQYDSDTRNAKAVLNDLGKYVPGYEDQGYEIAGFVFWQGHKDQNPAHASRYEQNLVHFIKSLRKDFDAPDAPFVCATIAFNGENLSGPGLTVANAQLAVSGETGTYPEFEDNVRTIDARPFWKDKEVSPSGAGHHYNHNAETYMQVGDALGRAMAALLEEKKN